MSIQDFQNFLDQLDEFFIKYAEMKESRDEFIKHFRATMIQIAYQYFLSKEAQEVINCTASINKNELVKIINSDEEVKYFAINIYETIIKIIKRFKEDDEKTLEMCAARTIDYTVYDQFWIENSLKEIEQDCVNLTKEQLNELRIMIESEALVESYYQDFDISIHKGLKKISLLTFPEITNISGAGIGEIDYFLYDSVFNIRNKILEVLDK